jgi:bifunctional DNase/RNase
MLIEVRVQSLGMDRVTNNPVVVLQEVDGLRVLPIWIGPAEASAIATHLAGVPLARPFTHDLLVDIAGGLGGTVKKVVITRVLEGTYYAELIIACDDKMMSVDARPSDSIAVALRTEAKIFADDSLLEHRADEPPGDDVDADLSGAKSELSEASLTMDAEVLKRHLKRLDPEDFGRFTP